MVWVPLRMRGVRAGNSQELSDVAPVHAHGGHFGAAVLVELVAARLATESVQEKLLAYVAEGELQVGFPNLGAKKEAVCNVRFGRRFQGAESFQTRWVLTKLCVVSGT